MANEYNGPKVANVLTQLTADEKHQAETFFKVLVKKRYNFYAMANILKHMGGLYLEWAKKTTKASTANKEK